LRHYWEFFILLAQKYSFYAPTCNFYFQRKLPLFVAMKKDEKEEIEHILILVVHGMGSDDGSLKQCKREFERSLNDIIRYWFWEIKVKVEVQFIDWKQTIISEQERLYNKLLPNEPFTQQFEFWNSNPRHVLNHSLSDLLFYMTPHYGRLMVKNATEQLNTIINGLSKVNIRSILLFYFFYLVRV
jgi:hypothetical protein